MKSSKRIKKINYKNKNLYRLVARVSNCNFYAQIIDDNTGKVLAAASSLKMEKKAKEKDKEVGKLIASLAKKAKISSVVFDRGDKRYHGHIKNIAEAARKAGLKI